MRIKKTIKRIGRCFIALKQENEGAISQSVLLVDNGYSWLGHLNSAIERIKNYFPRAGISVLTSEERKYNLQKDSPTLDYILLSQRIRPKRYQIALQMLMMRKKRHDFIVLFSLDITPLIVALIFLKSKVILYNQWGQWWTLRLRDVNEIFKITYIKKKVRFNFKNLLKRIGLFFVLLQREDEEALKHSILVVDNSYALYEQIGNAMQQIKEAMPGAKISLLALEQREELKNNLPNVDIIKPGKCIIKKYRIAWHIVRLRNYRYDYVILLSLDIIPIIASILFMKSKVLLYNQWYQWWSLDFKNIWAYLKGVLSFLVMVPIFIYLFVTTAFILFRTNFRLGLINLKSILGRRNENGYKTI